MLFFFLFFSVNSAISLAEDYCPCRILADICNPGCCCDVNCGHYNSSTCYPNRPIDPLPLCQSHSFRINHSLSSFLKNEIFCIWKDKRGIDDDLRNESLNTSFEINDTSNDKDSYSFNSVLLTKKDNNIVPLLLPTPDLEGNCQFTQVLQMYRPIHTIMCTPNSTISFPSSVLSYPSTESNLINSSSVNMEPFHYTLSIGYKNGRIIGMKYLTTTNPDQGNHKLYLDVEFLQEDQFLGNTNLTHGSLGFIKGQEIKVMGISNSEELTLPDYFCIPLQTYNYDILRCTPLQFGVDVLAHFPYPSKYISMYLNQTKYLPKYQNSSYLLKDDWIEIEYQYPNEIPSIPLTDLQIQLKYQIVYRKVGKTDNPQSIIVKASCSAMADSSQDSYIAVAWFEDTTTISKQYMPKKPKWLATLPDDFFFPFTFHKAV